MSEPHGFADRFQWIARSEGWVNPALPGGFIRMWEEFVEECVSGYEFDLAEYLNDLSIRGLLQKAMDDIEMKLLEQYSWFTGEVRRVDERFREAVEDGPVVWPDGEFWWRRKIPPIGSEDFVRDVRDRFSVELRLVD
ncbi:hypothetical protein [Streptomyces sp. NPDC096132]|uniref:hypothetical protein n=1 Tax=Streptomyces sp. NPDC096132 TaxID=3366075 RepID=UPI0038014F4F